MIVRKDDKVRVVAGEYVGKEGRVLATYPDDGRVVVENVNTVFRHLRRSQKNPAGGRIQKEAALSVSKVQLVCQKCGKTSRVKTTVVKGERGGKPTIFRYRVCGKCGEPVQPCDVEVKAKAAGEVVKP